MRKMNDRKLTSSIFIDLSKVFDTLSYAQIQENLSSTGVKGVEYKLFQDDLFNQKQIVIYGEVASDLKYAHSSDPQGWIVGPLLLLMACDGLSQVLIHCKIIMYPDNTVIYISDKLFSTIKSKLTEDFARVATWLKENQLIINLSKGKTEYMLFRTLQRTKNKTFDIVHDHKTPSETNSYKYLGIQLDQNLHIKDHTIQTNCKVCRRLQLPKHLRPKLTTEAAVTIYKSMILPLVTCCSLVCIAVNCI